MADPEGAQKTFTNNSTINLYMALTVHVIWTPLDVWILEYLEESGCIP